MFDDDEDELKYRYDTQLLIDGKNLSEESIRNYFNTQLVGNCLLAVGDSELKIWFVNQRA